MKAKLLYLLPLLFLVACTNNKLEQESPLPLFPQPKTIKANPEGGYVTNVVTGDTIQPLINSLGDTIVTGVPIKATGKKINPDSVAKPKSYPVPPQSELTIKNAHPNRHKIPKDLTVIPVNQDSLTKLLIEVIAPSDTSHYLVNSTGDTIKTGVPIPTKGKKVSTTQPQPTPALAPRFKDATNTNLQYLDVDQGLSSSYVCSVLEDKSGNLWFGSEGGGVSMYNGKSFTHYTEKEGLSSNMVYAILEDKSGNLWFGTYGGGVSMYNGKSFTHFTEKEGLNNNAVWSMLEDKSGNLWFGTWGRGVSMYNGKSFTHYTEKEGLPNNIVLSMVEDKSGNLWFGTYGGGVSMYNGKSFTHFTEKEGLSNNIVFSILEDESGNLWFGTNGGGVSMYNGKFFTHFTEKEGLSNNYVMSILEDRIGNLWFGTYGGGVSMLELSGAEGYNGKSFTHFTEKEGLSNNIVRSILEDRSGNLWFGTYGGGVSMYNGKPFTHFTEKEGLSNNIVRSIQEDRIGNLWFGTYGGGVSMYNGKSFTHFTVKEGLLNNIVSSIMVDKGGNLWFGSDGGGVSMYNGKSFTYFTEKEGLSNNNVFSILEDESGNLWFGTDGGGVSMYNGKFFTHFTEKEGLSNKYVMSILEDRSGNLWFGTYGGGVNMYNGKSFTYFTEKEGLSNNVVNSILEDKNGNLWFGTNGGGVSVYNGKFFTHFTEKEGLSNNTVYTILEDEIGNLWLSTESGLNQFVVEGGLDLQKQSNKKTVKATYKPVRYEKNDGLKAMDFYFNSGHLDSKNRIWWGSGKSLTMLDLNKHSIAAKPPAIYLNQLDINEQFIDYRNISDSLGNEIGFNDVQRFENYPLNLNLAYDKNHLTFHFAAIDWAAPHKIQYSYLIQGLNSTWSQPSQDTKADYRNLTHGTYTFKIRAIGESGEWSDAFEYAFTINPPWWHTWWARFLYAMAAILLIIFIVRWRTAKLKQRQKELETEVELATKEIKEQKEQVEEAHKEITDSINYAERIQRSFLATKELLDENLKDYFVFFQPKEAVSGDFYWAGKLDNGNFAVVNADSTGHGVPGAIMSILNISSIESAVKDKFTAPADIFNETRASIIDRLKNDGSEEGGKDGMDASIICFDFENNKFTYTAAQNPIWVIREGELTVIAPEKMPIGKHDKDHIPFLGGEFEMQKGDQIYTLTDGFQDQFGGPIGKKFMIKKMREFVLSISHLPMKEQDIKLKEVFTNWKGEEEQVDDVCVIGVKI